MSQPLDMRRRGRNLDQVDVAIDAAFERGAIAIDRDRTRRRRVEYAQQLGDP